jgi:hypothetical protein
MPEDPFSLSTQPFPPDLVENTETVEVFVLEPDGQLSRLRRTESAVIVDATGGRQFLERRYITRTNDGRLVQDPNAQLIACACGKTLLTSASIIFCVACTLPCCRSHAHTVPELGGALCDSCWNAVRRKVTWGRVWAWLTDLG